MSDLKSWSNSAGGNISPSPNGFPEGMAPSGVNDAARETMASVRRWYESAEWIDLGHTPVYVATDHFYVSAGQSATATYHIGRRIKALDGSSTIYGTIHSSTWSSSAVHIYTTNDGAANFTASLSSIAVGIISHANTSWPDLTATAAQVANQAYDAVAGAARNFGTTASANTVPIAGAGGQLDAAWIPSGLLGGVWDFTSDTSVSFSVTAAGAAEVTFGNITLPSAGKWLVVLNMPNFSLFNNSTGTVSPSATLGLYRSVDSVIRATAFDGSATAIATNLKNHFQYVISSSTTETLNLKLVTTYSTLRARTDYAISCRN